jgi:hypothetical protein
MPNIIDRFLGRVVKDFHVFVEAKTTFGLASLLLMGATAYITWTIAQSFNAERFATIEATTRNLLIQVGQLNKEGGPQSPQVYGSSRLQLLDIHVTFDPPHKPNIFGNVVNKGALAAHDPSSGASYLISQKDLTVGELDGLAAQAINARIGNRGIVFQPDEVHGFLLDFNVTQEQFEDVKAGKQKLYFMYVVSHLDEAVPAGKMRLTEACYIYAGGLDRGQLCSEHNLAFTADSLPTR